MNHEPLRWGILSTGRIAHTFAHGVAGSRASRLVAVGSRSPESAAKFAAEFPGVRAHARYEALLADPEVEAVYIATPHPQHALWAIRAAEAGKHILCEKPLTLNQAEAMAVAEAARVHGVLLMEAFMYRCHPQTARIAELVRSGALGRVESIQATFSFNANFNPASRIWSNELGGGGILDVGCYPVSFARLIAGAAEGRPFADPVEVKGVARLHPETGVDVHACAVLRFASGVTAQVATGVGLNQDNSARIYGTDGWIHVSSPWIPAKDGGTVAFTLHRRGAPAEEIAVPTDCGLYSLEADAVAAAVRAGAKETTAMPIADTLGNLAALDAWRASAGLVYHAEKPENVPPPVHGRPFGRRADAAIPAGEIAGVGKPVSRLVMGCDNQRTMPHAAIMWDDFFERGGNAFDTAYIYGGGLQERLLGHWMRARGVRDQTVVLVKGAHTPFCAPEHLTAQLHESLERLQTDYADLYIMHRDNPDIPVGEFIDVLNEHVRAGRIRVFGGSNWSLPRVAKANAYAKRKGLQGFGVVSNNFSLARMVDPVWAGCIAASDADSRRWFKRTQMPLLSWSSQARGFFTERAGRDKTGDAELVRCWYSEDNFERRERAIALAKEKGVEPINIALAYVLSQPFPTFALVGPRVLAETASTLGGANLALTAREIAWLNLERQRR
jgi:predicted dehydrogenase/aryl-alcohol dehydrogenase-like predicted oxidoreductase